MGCCKPPAVFIQPQSHHACCWSPPCSTVVPAHFAVDHCTQGLPRITAAPVTKAPISCSTASGKGLSGLTEGLTVTGHFMCLPYSLKHKKS